MTLHHHRIDVHATKHGHGRTHGQAGGSQVEQGKVPGAEGHRPDARSSRGADTGRSLRLWYPTSIIECAAVVPFSSRKG